MYSLILFYYSIFHHYIQKSRMSSNTEIILDASKWKNKDDFYSSYCHATKAPKWFGKNLDALLDSLRGGICKMTPEKIIVQNFTSKIKNDLGFQFWQEVEEICQEENVVLEVYSHSFIE